MATNGKIFETELAQGSSNPKYLRAISSDGKSVKVLASQFAKQTTQTQINTRVTTLEGEVDELQTTLPAQVAQIGLKLDEITGKTYTGSLSISSGSASSQTVVSCNIPSGATFSITYTATSTITRIITYFNQNTSVRHDEARPASNTYTVTFTASENITNIGVFVTIDGTEDSLNVSVSVRGLVDDVADTKNGLDKLYEDVYIDEQATFEVGYYSTSNNTTIGEIGQTKIAPNSSFQCAKIAVDKSVINSIYINCQGFAAGAAYYFLDANNILLSIQRDNNRKEFTLSQDEIPDNATYLYINNNNSTVPSPSCILSKIGCKSVDKKINDVISKANTLETRTENIEKELIANDYELGKTVQLVQPSGDTYSIVYAQDVVVGKTYRLSVACDDTSLNGMFIVVNGQTGGIEVNGSYKELTATSTSFKFNVSSALLQKLTAETIFNISIKGVFAAAIEDEFNEIDNGINDIETRLSDVTDALITEEQVYFEDGKYKSTNGVNVGDTINLNYGVNESGKVATVIIDESFQRLSFSTYGVSNATRPYIILDADNVVLEIGDEISKVTTKDITESNLPSGAARIIINYWSNSIISTPTATLITMPIKKGRSGLEGKRVICFGDSIMEGVGNELISWADYLGEYYGVNVTNIGVGGSHLTPLSLNVANNQNGLYVYNLVNAWYTQDFSLVSASVEWSHTNYGTRWDKVLTVLQNTNATDYDIAIISAGTNDWNNVSHILGDFNDVDPIRNISASLRMIIQMLHLMNPKLYILVLPPLVRYVGDDFSTATDLNPSYFSDTYQNVNSNLYLYDVSKTMMDVAKKMHVQSVDMYYDMEFNLYNWKIFTNDGTHPNMLGYKSMARYVGRQLCSRYCRQ